MPFDRRRHGTLLGMGACALVVESEDAVRERGMRGIAELLSSETANSAYHGTRLDVTHISEIMNRLVTAAERRFGLNRYIMAPQMAFISHETFTPARGGSAAAEIMALRNTFAEAANEIVVCNTKGFTGHPMGAGVEDVIAVKILEYGIVPPVPNFKEVDPELGVLNLSRGGRYPVQYALHLSAGFGSQIAMTLLRRIPGSRDRIDDKARYQRWLDDVSGYDQAKTEVVKRVLRIAAQGQPARSPAPSTWRYGTGPTLRAAAPGDGMINEYRPLPMPVVAAVVKDKAAIKEQRRASREDGAASAEPAPPMSASTASSKPMTPTPAPEPVSQAQTTQTETQTKMPQSAPPPPVQSEPVAAPASDPIVEQVLKIVAAKTGYPQDMLDLDLDLEADLGIDTVKQAETFASIREQFGIPFQEGLSLRDYPTLQSVIDFVRKMRPDLAEMNDEMQEAAPVSVASQTLQHLKSPPSIQTIGTLEDADRVPRRVPVCVLRPPLNLCKPTGVTIDASSRIVVMLDQGGVGQKLAEKLRQRGATVLTLKPEIATDVLSAQCRAWLTEGKIQGVFWLPALDVEPAIETMTLEEWREHNRVRVKNLYATMRALYDSVSGPNTFLVSATRLGGLHGYGPVPAVAPLRDCDAHHSHLSGDGNLERCALHAHRSRLVACAPGR